jgi:acetyltransferase
MAPIQGRKSQNTQAKAIGFLSGKSGVLSEFQSKQLLQYYDIPVVREELVTSEMDAVEVAKTFGFPVVLKGISSKIIHKTEAGILELNLQDDHAVRVAYQEISRKVMQYVSEDEFEGVLVQEMITGGVEVFSGLINDQVFGPGIVFGLGGIYVELFEDKAIAIPPLSHQEALKMIKEVRGARILDGYRDQRVYDIEALADFIGNLSALSIDLRDFVSEIDINPVIVFERNYGVKVVDATVKLQEIPGRENR